VIQILTTLAWAANGGGGGERYFAMAESSWLPAADDAARPEGVFTEQPFVPDRLANVNSFAPKQGTLDGVRLGTNVGHTLPSGARVTVSPPLTVGASAPPVGTTGDVMHGHAPAGGELGAQNCGCGWLPARARGRCSGQYNRP
jgi:hypothetical protein